MSIGMHVGIAMFSVVWNAKLCLLGYNYHILLPVFISNLRMHWDGIEQRNLVLIKHSIILQISYNTPLLYL